MGVSYVYCRHPTIVTETHLLSIQSSAMVLFTCGGKSLVPGLSMGGSRAALGLSCVGSDWAFARTVVTLNCRAFSPCCPLRYIHCWAESADRPDVCLQLTARAAVEMVYVVSSSLLRTRVTLGWCWLLSGLLAHFQTCGTALDEPLLKGRLEKVALQKNMGVRFTILASFAPSAGGDLKPLWRTPKEVMLKGADPLENMAVGHRVLALCL